MQLFECPSCSATVFFDSTVCEKCQAELGYAPGTASIVPNGSPCSNRHRIGCNWQVQAVQSDHCDACRLTTVIPDTSTPENLKLWARSEAAKRWVLTNLAGWGWFDRTDSGPRPQFHLLSEQTRQGKRRVSMGHKNGVVTINVVEADPIVRATRREQFNEPFRTMIGHFRHELAHYLFLQRLSSQPDFIEEFRALMGDERISYDAAIADYYDIGPADGWQQSFVTEYASSHPHEDWAETFAHLLHLTDIADTFISVGFSSVDVADKNFSPYRAKDADLLLSFATELTIGLNQLNRSMGLSDIYPFVLTPAVREKIGFVHKWVAAGPVGGAGQQPANALPS